MAFKLFGMKCRLELVVLTLMVGLFLGSTLLCNCMTYENFEPLHPAPAREQRDEALEGKWMSQQQFPANPHKAMLGSLQGNTGLTVPLADDQMLIFSQNKLKAISYTYLGDKNIDGCWPLIFFRGRIPKAGALA